MYKKIFFTNNKSGDDMVKKGIIFVIIICILTGMFIIVSSDEGDEMRIRILSNSNSEIDQQEKQIVKSELEEILKENSNLNYLEIEKKLIERTKEKINNEIKITICKSYYPAKSYNGKFIPSGAYNTLLITIGEGRGSNFWTLLYPEYFNISFEDNNEIEYRVYFLDIIREIFNLDTKVYKYTLVFRFFLKNL